MEWVQRQVCSEPIHSLTYKNFYASALQRATGTWAYCVSEMGGSYESGDVATKEEAFEAVEAYIKRNSA